MITSEISLHSFLNYIQMNLSYLHEERLAKSHENNKTMYIRKRVFLKCFSTNCFCKTTFAKSTSVDLGFWLLYWSVYTSSTFSTGNEPTIFCSHHAYSVFHILHAYLRLFWCSNEHFINFVPGIKRTLFLDLDDPVRSESAVFQTFSSIT